jgi:hypothetical protein
MRSKSVPTHEGVVAELCVGRWGSRRRRRTGVHGDSRRTARFPLSVSRFCPPAGLKQTQGGSLEGNRGPFRLVIAARDSRETKHQSRQPNRQRQPKCREVGVAQPASGGTGAAGLVRSIMASLTGNRTVGARLLRSPLAQPLRSAYHYRLCAGITQDRLPKPAMEEGALIKSFSLLCRVIFRLRGATIRTGQRLSRARKGRSSPSGSNLTLGARA